MRNLLLTICYDGRSFHGWQIQKNAVTVQEIFQIALNKILNEPNIEIKGCSRTDSLVHANMYCVSLKTNRNIACEKLVMALNHHLPKEIAVLNAKEMPQDFHARYSCCGKEYIYKIWNNKIRNPFLENYALHYWYNLDEVYLNKLAQEFVGTHDFTSFCTLDSRTLGDFCRTVKNFEIKREGSLITLKVQADGFLYNMVRIMVGTILKASQKNYQPGKISEIIKAKNRGKAGPTAPPCGLYLNKVFYKD